jgi:hypothetical protein
LLPREIKIITLDEFLHEEGTEDYRVLSLLPINRDTRRLFVKLRRRVRSIAGVSLFIPWESSFKAFIRTWVVRLLLSPDEIHSFGLYRFSWILPEGTIKYHPLPNQPTEVGYSGQRTGEYIVFVDQALPTHPDSSVTGKTVDADSYYRCVTASLEAIGRQLCKRVLVCRHPKGRYVGQEFGDLEISEETTEKAISSASLVVGHYSLALLTAALHDLPIVILDVSATGSRAIVRETTAFARLLKVKPFQAGLDHELQSHHIAANAGRSKLVRSYMYGLGRFQC